MERTAVAHISFKECFVTYPRDRYSIRICAPLLLTALAVAFVLAGFMNNGPGDLEAAETAQNEPATPGAPVAPPAPVAPAIPPVAPGAATPTVAPGTPPLAAPETQPAAPAKTKKAAKGKKAAKQAKGKNGPPPGKIAPPGKYNAGEDPEYAQRHGSCCQQNKWQPRRHERVKKSDQQVNESLRQIQEELQETHGFAPQVPRNKVAQQNLGAVDTQHVA